MSIVQLLGYIASYLGYFLWLIIPLVIAIIRCTKKKHAWIWYVLGAVWTFVSLIGKQRVATARGEGNETIAYWVIYFLLLIVAALIIVFRCNKANRTKSETKNYSSNHKNK